MKAEFCDKSEEERLVEQTGLGGVESSEMFVFTMLRRYVTLPKLQISQQVIAKRSLGEV